MNIEEYQKMDSTIGLPKNATQGTYYLKLSASVDNRIFSTITQVVQVVESDKLPLVPDVKIQLDSQYRVYYLTINNPSPRSIILDSYTLERQVNGVWVSSLLDGSMREEKVVVEEGKFWWKRLDFSKLERGDYRIVSLVSYVGGEPQRFYAFFKAD